MTTPSTSTSQPSLIRIRIGIAVWLLSWIPLPVFAVTYLHSQGHLQSDSAEAIFLGVTWTLQYAIGFIGIFVAGRELFASLHHTPRRHVPRAVWDVVIHGKVPSN